MSLLSRFNRKTVLVIGTFRSGTNLMKYFLEEHFQTEVLFSEWFWKHGLPPTHLKTPVPKTVPIILVTKEPTALNASLYHFWKKTRPELVTGQTMSDFISSPFIVHDRTGGGRLPEYLFPTPTEYWNQYHYAWCRWQEIKPRLSIVQSEQLLVEPGSILSDLARKYGLKPRNNGPVILPEKPVIPSNDAQTAKLADAKADAPQKKETLTPADKALIHQFVNLDVARDLGYLDRSPDIAPHS